MAYYVISYVYGDPALQDAHRPAHREYLSTRVQEGTIVVSGPLLKDSVSVGALLIAQVDSFDAAETIVKNDPMKIGGAVESYTIGEWTLVRATPRYFPPPPPFPPRRFVPSQGNEPAGLSRWSIGI